MWKILETKAEAKVGTMGGGKREREHLFPVSLYPLFPALL
jgi:hypothetical protein